MNELKVYDYIIAVDVLVGLTLLTRLQPWYMKWAVCLLVVTLFVEVSMAFNILKLKGNNYLPYTIFTPIEFALYGLVFYSAFDSERMKRFVVILMIIVAVFSVLNYFLLQKKVFNSYSFVVSCVGLTLIAFSYLNQLYSPTIVYRFYQYPLFWVAIGMLFFYPASVFSTGFIGEISKYDRQMAVKLYSINGILNVLLYSSFLVALLIASIKRFNLKATNA
jgi:hypothetical protein